MTPAPTHPRQGAGESRWAVYRFECPYGCSALEIADHHRRDPGSMRSGYCTTHPNIPRGFRDKRPLYEARTVEEGS